MKTLVELYDFALKHNCGEFTALALDFGTEPPYWLDRAGITGVMEGLPEVCLVAGRKNLYRNLLYIMQGANVKREYPLTMRLEDVILPVRSFAVGQTPDGFSKALVLQA